MIRADIDLGVSGFLASLAAADAAVLAWAAKFRAVMERFPATFAAVGVAAAGAAVVAFGLKNALDLGGELADLSASTGQSVGDLAVLRQAFENAGLGADQVGPTVARFQKALSGVNEEGNDTAEALSRLGISGASLSQSGTVEQLEALQGAFAGITDPIERTRLATELFGKSGAKMLAILGDSGALEGARTQVGGLAGIMEKFAPLFDRVGDAIGALAVKVQQFFAGALSVVAPRLVGFLEEAAAVDLTGLGVAFGVVLDVILEVLAVLKPVFDLMVKVANLANTAFGSQSRTTPSAMVKASGGDFEAVAKVAPAAVSALQAVGLDGYTGGGAVRSDPLLDIGQRTLRVMENIERNTTPRPGGVNAPRYPGV